MRVIVIPLEQIIIDPERGVDLVSMPLEEAVARIKECYSGFSQNTEVSVDDGLATITFPDLSASPDAAAVHEHAKGTKLAERGDFKRSIPFFQKAVNLCPGFVAARRDLAMSFLDAGEPDIALNHLIDVLRQDPKDVWSHVLVANIFLKSKQNLEAAETYYKSALAIAPDDVYALSNYAVFLMNIDRLNEARNTFERAIASNPGYPNPYLGLAIFHTRHGDPRDSLPILDNLFRQSRAADSRANMVYIECQRLFASVNQQLADITFEQAMLLVDGLRSDWTARSGTPVDLIEDQNLEQVDAICETAWNNKRDRHIIRYRIKHKAVLPHHIAHELEHLVIEDEAFQNNRAKSFMLTGKTMALAKKALQNSSDNRKKPDSGDQNPEVLHMIITGQCNQLFNCPVDMFIESNLYNKHPLLRPAQFVSLQRTNLSNLTVFHDREVARMAPKLTLRANLSMNCAYALFTDWLYNGATEYSAAYKKSSIYSTGKRLFGLFQDSIQNFMPGDEYVLVDKFASVLKLSGWYEWGPARYSGEKKAQEDKETKPPFQSRATDLDLLRQKESSAVAYCLGALQLFEGMLPEEVKAVTFEIAMAGTDGIDYSSPEERYTLQTLPGRRFTGIQLLSMMYVGFKRIEPNMDTGIPLDNEYRQALAMFKQKKNKCE